MPSWSSEPDGESRIPNIINVKTVQGVKTRETDGRTVGVGGWEVSIGLEFRFCKTQRALETDGVMAAQQCECTYHPRTAHLTRSGCSRLCYIYVTTIRKCGEQRSILEVTGATEEQRERAEQEPEAPPARTPPEEAQGPGGQRRSAQTDSVRGQKRENLMGKAGKKVGPTLNTQ